MSSVSFDPIAHLYDATRGYPDAAALQIAQAIEQAAHATAQTAFLEVGIGTGRIAFPLASLGHTYTGIDISHKMLAELEKKLRMDAWLEDERPWGSLPDENTALVPSVQRFVNEAKQSSLRLVRSDMTQLPFRDAAFDAAVAVHVFHLVSDWQLAVREVLRVLRPGGMLLHCWDKNTKGDLQLIGNQWSTFLQEAGGNTRRPGATSTQEVYNWLRAQGFQSEVLAPLFWKIDVTPRRAIENFTRRYMSGTWSIPDNIFSVASERLWQWANTYYGAQIDTPRTQDRCFIISTVKV
ncbi:MAG: methyltransferase domain-containing protein [Ktedonobacteraceae bacterium]|nr:methyltransferase domain-containing protein [Ktedonobacteraceae bacterium]